jgi:hypothetical protein
MGDRLSQGRQLANNRDDAKLPLVGNTGCNDCPWRQASSLSARKLEACGYTGTGASQERVHTMTLSQFNCPHCSGPFQVDTSLPTLQVACPHCRQPVALASEPPVSESPVSAPPMAEPPLFAPPPPAQPQIAGIPANRPQIRSPADLLPPGASVSRDEVEPQGAREHDAITDALRSRQALADDRASRKFVKNMIVWVCCTIVLVSILAYFLR